jgi:hypothetical protein
MHKRLLIGAGAIALTVGATGLAGGFAFASNASVGVNARI